MEWIITCNLPYEFLIEFYLYILIVIIQQT